MMNDEFFINTPKSNQQGNADDEPAWVDPFVEREATPEQMKFVALVIVVPVLIFTTIRYIRTCNWFPDIWADDTEEEVLRQKNEAERQKFAPPVKPVRESLLWV